MTAPPISRVLSTPDDLQRVLPRPLDDDQLTAATAPLEPSLVVAGAGSGKTTLMAARVVWLVGSGQVAPDRILGLTFTNKAAAELGSRVRSWLASAGVGPQDPLADVEPTVSTYHAFAGRIVRDHGLRVGIEPDSRLITDATRFMLAMRAMREVEGEFSALEVGPDFIAERLLNLAGELAEHLVTVDQLRQRDHEIIASAEQAPKQTQPVLKVASTARQRLELARLVEAYTREKREPGSGRLRRPDRACGPDRRRAPRGRRGLPRSTSASCSWTSTRTPRSRSGCCSPACSAVAIR